MQAIPCDTSLCPLRASQPFVEMPLQSYKTFQVCDLKLQALYTSWVCVCMDVSPDAGRCERRWKPVPAPFSPV